MELVWLILSVCVDIVKHFQVASPTVFLKFSWNFAYMIYVPVWKKTGTDFQNFDFKIFDEFKKKLSQQQSCLVQQASSSS